MRKLLAETVGTFALVFAGTGAIVVNEVTGGTITHVGIALTFGLIVVAMAYAIGPVSGGHMNPAVTLALTTNGSFPATSLALYFVGQCLGACTASALLLAMFPTSSNLGATIPREGFVAASFILEFVTTMLLVIVVLGVSSSNTHAWTGLAAGATVALEALFAGPISGASMNPARSLAPALISGHIEFLWIYLTAPWAGALLGVAIHRILNPRIETP
jgi:aquaporin Z